MRPYYEDTNPHEPQSSPFTPAVKVLLLVNVGVFVAQVFFRGVLEGGFALSLDGLRRFFLWQLLTYGFLHAGTLHLFFNMLALFIFGRELEVKYGTRRFVRLYLLAVVFSGAVYGAWCLSSGETRPLIGASGGVMALMLVYAILWPRRQFLLFLVLPVQAWFLAALWVLLNIGHALNESGTGVVHVAGAAFGFAWLKLGPVLGRQSATLRNRSARRARAADQRERKQMDGILDKVHKHGLHSLSRREKRFLTRMSRKMDDQKDMEKHRLPRRPEWPGDSP